MAVRFCHPAPFKEDIMSFINKVNIGPTTYWHPWQGCHRVSPACKNCFIRNIDNFILGSLTCRKLPPHTCVLVCLWSDFFLEEADPYRKTVWEEIKNQPEVIFIIITKRVERIRQCLPEDWNNGYDNVVISVTVETQELVKKRLNIFKTIPCKHRWISCCPLIEHLDLTEFLKDDKFEHVECCGETGVVEKIRPTYYEWVKSLSDQCKQYNKRFSFMKVGHKFIYQNVQYTERSICYKSPMADSLELDNYIPITYYLKNGNYTI